MTKRVGNNIIIEETAPALCSQCAQLKELRPYGKNGAWVCFPCAMEDEDETKAQFNKLIDGSRDI